MQHVKRWGRSLHPESAGVFEPTRIAACTKICTGARALLLAWSCGVLVRGACRAGFPGRAPFCSVYADKLLLSSGCAFDKDGECKSVLVELDEVKLGMAFASPALLCL